MCVSTFPAGDSPGALGGREINKDSKCCRLTGIGAVGATCE
jgi:hypothetical protein